MGALRGDPEPTSFNIDSDQEVVTLGGPASPVTTYGLPVKRGGLRMSGSAWPFLPVGAFDHISGTSEVEIGLSRCRGFEANGTSPADLEWQCTIILSGTSASDSSVAQTQEDVSDFSRCKGMTSQHPEGCTCIDSSLQAAHSIQEWFSITLDNFNLGLVPVNGAMLIASDLPSGAECRSKYNDRDSGCFRC